ncbi:RlmE family RNA methyltransferase [Candidatus Woesearchaeota archaeon]|nr:MAG: RlmE family RNA methyltransferase [Candidatus Woesearchaeota archaeon]
MFRGFLEEKLSINTCCVEKGCARGCADAYLCVRAATLFAYCRVTRFFKACSGTVLSGGGSVTGFDVFGRRARREGLRARSAFKLLSIQKKYGVLKNNDVIIDLGAFPGGWSSVASRFGSVVGVDMKPVEPIEGCRFVKGDFFDDAVVAQLPVADVVLSDAAPATTGVRDQDQFRSFVLAERALFIAKQKLKRGGSFVCKVFQGREFESFVGEVRRVFSFVKTTKPEASRKESKEMYLVAKGFEEV